MNQDTAPPEQTSEKGWVRAQSDNRSWIPCPLTLPEGYDRDSWSRLMAKAWWDQSGLTYTPAAVEPLAAMIARIHARLYATVPCHQVWIYLRDPGAAPLPVTIGIWKMHGERDKRLRLLSGADDASSTRPPDVTEFVTGNLGGGIRALHYRQRDSGLMTLLGYAFRDERLETDLQISTATSDPRLLSMALAVIDTFVHGITVYAKEAPG